MRLACVASLMVSCALTTMVVAEDANNAIDFRRDIKPLLAKHCVDCHGPDESNGGLRLDHPKGAFVETDSAARAIVPKHPESSELLQRILSDDEATRMPPEGPRIREADVALLRNWIRQGAHWPSDTSGVSETPSTVAKHWAYRRITSEVIPKASENSWSGHPIDRFLQRHRREAHLSVAADASPRQVLRRMSFDLLGLPPTLQQIEDFTQAWQQKGADAAIADAVDTLLAKPQYGERWGRHWMDWVRYADTAGDNSDYPIPQAYLYRNYIIDSFNQDVPYDRFLIEQLAGDLLPADNQEQRNRQVIATGYLAMARRFGSLVERYPWHLTIEDTIDNVGKTMLGMTLACARCHDHKFDPVSTRDYYGLYGFFASTRYPFPGIELFKAQHHFVSLLSPEETKSHLEPFREKTTKLQQDLDQKLEVCRKKAEENAKRFASATIDQQRQMRDELDGLLIRARKAGEALAAHLKAIPQYPTAYAVSDAQPVDAAIQIKGEPFRPGAVVPRKFPEVLGGKSLDPSIAEQGSGRLELARWIASPDNPLTARVIVNRVWERHFGRGIVPSTTDFGLRGQSPDHPELLDWLASDFIASGWSIKQLHRRILTSRTYRLASDPVANQIGRDPENISLCHQRRKRLDAESIRDTMLLISGQLDPTPMNEPHPFPDRADWSFTQHHPFKDAYDSRHRSVYLMSKRLTADRYFQTFDGPDRNVCTQSRDQSITALQALYFVNNDFLHDQAEHMASQVAQGRNDKQVIDDLFGKILQRLPSPDERRWLIEHVQATREHLSGDDSNAEAWASLIRSLFRLNEFIYID